VTAPEWTPEWTPERIAEVSAAELAAGRLPMRAQWRLAEQRERAERGESGAFTSDLTVEEFAAIRSVGFSPVGQVLGSAVYNVGWAYSGCGYYGYYGYGVAPVVPVPATQQLLNQARHRAVNRMRQECAALGGDGVVAVRLMVERFHGIGLEFFAIGTAVRADGPSRPKQPFTSDLSGQDFAKLLRAGWVPVALVQGVGAVVRHKDRMQLAWGSSWYNQELIGQTKLVQAARVAARDSLTTDARHAGGHTVVLRDTVLQVFEQRCASGSEGEDQYANAFLWGTAIVPFEPANVPETPLQILRLNR
jgi:uncharacterized protein YbjQ (UPF0145 family)